MTNFEHYFDSKIERLLECVLDSVKGKAGCVFCLAKGYCSSRCGSCSEILAEWLEEDYKEYDIDSCPFCGNDDIGFLKADSAWTMDPVGDGEENFSNGIACCCGLNRGGCGATGRYCSTKNEAVRCWNRRV